MTIEQLKRLRIALIVADQEINCEWKGLGIEHDHYLSEVLADLIIKLESTIDNVNQVIGELN